MSPNEPCPHTVHGEFFLNCGWCKRSNRPDLEAKARQPLADALPPETRVRIDKPGKGFNGSHLPGYLAWRVGWAGSEVWVNDKCLRDLRHERCGYGREDPRLFTFRDRLHVAFTGVDGPQGPTHQLYARLRSDLSVDRVWAPEYERRRSWEKNWSFFELDRRLYAVYSIAPHVVLRVDDDRVTAVYETLPALAWFGGHQRGGASPVRVGEFFYSFFHGCKDVQGKRKYSVGVYKFEAKPPFRPVAMTPDPLYWAPYCPDYYADVVFPGGATLEDGVWTVTAGADDRRLEQYTWRHTNVERLLRGPTVRRALPCLHLDKLVKKAGCSCSRKDTYLCGKGHGHVQQERQCEECSDYEPDG